jgi:hypothetical protein
MHSNNESRTRTHKPAGDHLLRRRDARRGCCGRRCALRCGGRRPDSVGRHPLVKPPIDWRAFRHEELEICNVHNKRPRKPPKTPLRRAYSQCSEGSTRFGLSRCVSRPPWRRVCAEASSCDRFAIALTRATTTRDGHSRLLFAVPPLGAHFVADAELHLLHCC